jgi:hypothetical protein
VPQPDAGHAPCRIRSARGPELLGKLRLREIRAGLRLRASPGLPHRTTGRGRRAAPGRTPSACKANGKFAGLGGVYHPPLMARYIGMGFRLILAGSDLSLLLAAARERAAAVRAMTPG